MIKLNSKKFKTRILSSVTNISRDTRGVAAVEFAFIAPIMIFMYFGLAEIASAITMDRQVSHTSNIAGDLATQVSEISADDMEEILVASLKVLGVSDVANVKMEIASYDMDDSNNARLVGKATLNPSAPQELQAFDKDTVDARLLNSTSGVVVTRIAYKFEPIKVQYFDTDLNLRETFLLKPRRSASVMMGDAIGTEFTCTSTNVNSVSC